MSEPEPVLDERGRIDAATSVEAIIAKGWMRFPHDPPHPDSFALADAAITAYQSATGEALTEALRERDRLLAEREQARRVAARIAAEQPPPEDIVGCFAALTEAEHRAERAEKVVEAAKRVYVIACETNGEASDDPIMRCMSCDACKFHVALAALDTTAGPGGTQ